MTNEEHIIALTDLKNNLYNNQAIYHERVTILIELIEFDVGETHVRFKAKVIKPLDEAHAQKIGLYHLMITKEFITFGSAYQWSNGEQNADIIKLNNINGAKLGRPYCPYTLWLDKDLVQYVSENNNEATKGIAPRILWNEPWQGV